ncbi:MAG: DUF2207 domain-containing protein [Ginsengibacter sp.]
MKKLFSLILFFFVAISCAKAQEYFTINNYDVSIKVNKNASLDITEKIDVAFTEPRHGIIRKIPYKYKLQSSPQGADKAEMPGLIFSGG